MIKKIQIKDVEGNITGTYDVGQIDPNSVSTIDDLVSNAANIKSLASNSNKIINTVNAFNNNTFTTSYTTDGLSIDGNNVIVTADLSFNKSNTISSGNLNSNPATSQIKEIVTIPYTKKQDESAYGILINLQDFINAANGKDGYTDIKFNIELFHEFEIVRPGDESVIGPFEPMNHLNEQGDDNISQEIQTLDDVEDPADFVHCQYMTSYGVVISSKKINKDDKHKTITFPLSEIKQAISDGAVELFIYMLYDQDLYNNVNLHTEINMKETPGLECAVYDILTLVNWAKTNGYGPWAD